MKIYIIIIIISITAILIYGKLKEDGGYLQCQLDTVIETNDQKKIYDDIQIELEIAPLIKRLENGMF